MKHVLSSESLNNIPPMRRIHGYCSMNSGPGSIVNAGAPRLNSSMTNYPSTWHMQFS